MYIGGWKQVQKTGSSSFKTWQQVLVRQKRFPTEFCVYFQRNTDKNPGVGIFRHNSYFHVFLMVNQTIKLSRKSSKLSTLLMYTENWENVLGENRSIRQFVSANFRTVRFRHISLLTLRISYSASSHFSFVFQVKEIGDK